MSSDEIAIRVRGVSKHYLMFKRPQDRLKQSIMPRLQRLAGQTPKSYYRDFAALSHVSFDAKRGETVGIVGRNGSGKSTLLQIICGTLQPNAGAVEVNGRVAALLELGAGFNPDFTGRENVYLNGAILGLTRSEVEARFDDIARFADIGDFIEEPVKTYSSGMYVRLAFATAINVDPDILVIDEALAVGDEAFQRKCFGRIEQIQDRGGTILFVTHATQTVVQLCTRAILLDGGELILDGVPKLVTSQYQRLINLERENAWLVREEIKSIRSYGIGINGSPQSSNSVPFPDLVAEQELGDYDESYYDDDLVSTTEVQYEADGAKIRDVKVVAPNGIKVNILTSGKTYFYKYIVDFTKPMSNVGFGMLIKTITGVELGGAATDFSTKLRLASVKAGSSYEVIFELPWRLNPGTYFLNAGVTGTYENRHSYRHRLLDALAIKSLPRTDMTATGYIDFDARFSYRCVSEVNVKES